MEILITLPILILFMISKPNGNPYIDFFCKYLPPISSIPILIFAISPYLLSKIRILKYKIRVDDF